MLALQRELNRRLSARRIREQIAKRLGVRHGDARSFRDLPRGGVRGHVPAHALDQPALLTPSHRAHQSRSFFVNKIVPRGGLRLAVVLVVVGGVGFFFFRGDSLARLVLVASRDGIARLRGPSRQVRAVLLPLARLGRERRGSRLRGVHPRVAPLVIPEEMHVVPPRAFRLRGRRVGSHAHDLRQAVFPVERRHRGDDVPFAKEKQRLGVAGIRFAALLLGRICVERILLVRPIARRVAWRVVPARIGAARVVRVVRWRVADGRRGRGRRPGLGGGTLRRLRRRALEGRRGLLGVRRFETRVRRHGVRADGGVEGRGGSRRRLSGCRGACGRALGRGERISRGLHGDVRVSAEGAHDESSRRVDERADRT